MILMACLAFVMIVYSTIVYFTNPIVYQSNLSNQVFYRRLQRNTSVLVEETITLLQCVLRDLT